MADERSSAGGGGLGLASVLLVIFLVLKLTGLIDWSWWWVLSPCWISTIIFVVILMALIGFAILGAVLRGK